MKVAVVGSGYVGLVSGTCFSEKGNKLCSIGIDEEWFKKQLVYH